MEDIFSKFKKNPLGFIKRVLYKLIIGPLKYSTGDDYKACKYWHDRFSKYGQSIRGSGDEGLSEEENKKMYTEAAKVFTDLCQKQKINFKNVSVLEIGCGSGFYTGLLYNLGVRNYLGVDITDVLLPELKEKFPKFRFNKKDITSDKIKGKFDLIVMIDVIEHIVNEVKFSCAMENIKNCLSERGMFIIAPIMRVSKKRLFYIRLWSLQDIKQKFSGYIFGELLPFRNNHIFTIRKT